MGVITGVFSFFFLVKLKVVTKSGFAGVAGGDKIQAFVLKMSLRQQGAEDTAGS